MKIENGRKDQKKRFRLTRNRMGNDTNVKIPNYTLAVQLPVKLNKLFLRKITAIWDVFYLRIIYAALL